MVTSRDEAFTLLESLFTLHGARWRSCGSPGVLADETVRQFHRQAISALANLGLLRMHMLRRDGTPVAVGYMLAAKGRAYDYITGFDPEVAALGAGTVLVGCAIEAATAEGAHEFDFLRGREAYKYRWRARPTDLRSSPALATGMIGVGPLSVGIRWTIGDVNRRGFEALRLSIWGVARLRSRRSVRRLRQYGILRRSS